MKDIIIRNFLPVLILLIYMSCVNTQLAMSGYQISYNELRTNLPGGRQANTSTMRAAIIGFNGKGRRLIKEELANEPNSCTQFAGWSPDGKWLLYGSKKIRCKAAFCNGPKE